MRKMKPNFAAMLREIVFLHIRKYVTDSERRFAWDFSIQDKRPLVWGKTSTDVFSLRDVDSIVFGSLPCTVLRCYTEALVGVMIFLDMQVEL